MLSCYVQFQKVFFLSGFAILYLTHEYGLISFFILDDATRVSDSFADGLWHSLLIEVTGVKVNCTVDRNVKVSNRALSITPSDKYFVGEFYSLFLISDFFC